MGLGHAVLIVEKTHGLVFRDVFESQSGLIITKNTYHDTNHIKD